MSEHPDLVDVLRSMPLFEAFSDDQLGWLVEQGEVVHYDRGELVHDLGGPADYFYVLIDGELQVTTEVDGREVPFVTSDRPGSWAGGGAFMETQTYPVRARVVRDSRVFRIGADTLQYMLTNGFPIATHLLRGISMGMRDLEALTRQQETLATLGKLSAGLAHELNNPASAAKRAASQLRHVLQAAQAALLEVVGGGLSDQLRELQADVIAAAESPPTLSPLEESDREDEVTRWLEDHGVGDEWEASPALVQAGLGVDWLDHLAGCVGEDRIASTLHLLVQTVVAFGLAHELEESAQRIADLVAAVKSYSYMDQAPIQEVDVHGGIESTLKILGHKLKAGIEVERDYGDDVPKIWARGPELNQVWTNVIDNAADALGGKGRIRIRTRRDGDDVVVDINDDGPGIPAAVQARMFEPFFTTKEAGQGSGLGLEIAQRIVVRQHNGTLTVRSEPGSTTFTVRLPIRQT